MSASAGDADSKNLPAGTARGARARRFAGPALIVLAAAVAVAPQLARGNSCGHDFDFHLVSWFDCLDSWRHGILYPHWAPSANYGAGEPRFVFYPPLTWMLGAALGAVLPWALAPIALTFLCLAGTGLATRALAREAWSDGVATLAGCTALFSGYALFTAYERSAFGEMTGGLWIPLLLLWALRERRPEGSFWRRAFDGSALPLALVVAGAWLSDAPLGVLAFYLLAAVALLRSLLERSAAPALRAAVAAVLGTGLAALYLLPVAAEQGWINLQRALADPGMKVESSWLFARHASRLLAAHDAELSRVSLIAVSMIAVALGGLLVSWRRGRLPARRSWWLPLAVIPLAILLLQLPASEPVWRLLPKLAFLQFPWRWLVALEAPMGLFFAAGVWLEGRRWHAVVVAVLAAAFAGVTLVAGANFFQPCDEEDAVAPMLNVYRADTGFAGVDEYAPPGTDTALAAVGLPEACLVSVPTLRLGRRNVDGVMVWSPAQQNCAESFAASTAPAVNPEHWRLHVVTEQPGYLVLRLRRFPAWRIRVNGHAPASLPRRMDGLVALPVPRGPVEVTVDWATTSDVVAARWLSGLSLVLLAGLGGWERRRFAARLS